jgi:hypothetical protein
VPVYKFARDVFVKLGDPDQNIKITLIEQFNQTVFDVLVSNLFEVRIDIHVLLRQAIESNQNLLWLELIKVCLQK